MTGNEQFAPLPPGLGGPAELVGAAVPGAARAHGARSVLTADAVVTVDAAEHARRARAGLGAVVDYSALYALMCLPLDAVIAVADLGDVVRRVLGRAPAGCVDWLDGGAQIRRRYVPAATAPLVVLRAATWRPARRRAWAFEPFAARAVLLARPPRSVPDIAWEADVAGIGLWIRHPGGDVEEVVAPARHVQRYVKPAGWRFAEHAYAAWLTHHQACAEGPATDGARRDGHE